MTPRDIREAVMAQLHPGDEASLLPESYDDCLLGYCAETVTHTPTPIYSYSKVIEKHAELTGCTLTGAIGWFAAQISQRYLGAPTPIFLVGPDGSDV